MAFVETFSPFILFKLSWKPADKDVQNMFERQWRNLRQAVLFCLRHHPGQHTPEQLRKAKRQFENYAFAAQEVRFVAYVVIHCSCHLLSGSHAPLSRMFSVLTGAMQRKSCRV